MKILLLLVLAAAPAAALRPLTANEKRRCEEAAARGFPDWRTAKPMPAPSPDKAALPLELPLDLFVVNHKSFWSYFADEDELAWHLQRAREVFRPCGIEPTVRVLRYVDAPEFLDVLDRGADNDSRLTDRERCLMTPLRDPAVVAVYFVEGVDSRKGRSVSHALGPRTFVGGEYSNEPDKSFGHAAIVTDVDRAGGLSRDRRVRELVFTHEIGHVVLDLGEDRQPGNLMSDDLKHAMRLTPAQCERARASRFVRPR